VDAATDPAELLAAYDALRERVPDPLPAGVTVERDGPVHRYTGFAHGGFVGYRDLGGVDGTELDALIARQRDHFAARGEKVEWKLHEHDAPADLADHLRAAGFQPDERETVVIGPVAALAVEPLPPPGVTLREVRERADLRRMEDLHEAIWDDRMEGYAEDLARDLEADPERQVLVFAEVGELLVCAARVVFEGGTPFATLWGGGTLPEWRGRGIYRAVVAYRAQLAAARGYRYLQVDASDDSRPILQRLGMVAVTTTTPYIWRPPA
jgi:GNAT superfamily N-acetyltransferase